MKINLPACLVLLGVTAGVNAAHAQSGLSAYFGVGTATTSSNGQQIDTFGDGTLFTTPSMTGAFGKAGADFMINRYLGIGGETDFRFSQGNYAGLKYRPLFYDFNAVLRPPVHSKRIVPEFQAGLGGVNIRFYQSQSYCDSFAGCSTSNSYVEGSNHLQVHMSAGIRFYVTQNLFVRPQIDAHWVNNFYQFGSPWVPEYGAAIGYTFGEH